MNIYILDYCNLYSAHICYTYEYVHILTFGQFDNTFRNAHSSHWPSSVKVSYTEDHQTIIKDVPPIHKVVLMQHGSDLPLECNPTQRISTKQGVFLVTASKLWNSSTKYDNGSEIISSVDSLMSQNYNKTNYHSLKFGVQALCLKSHPMWLQILLFSCKSPPFLHWLELWNAFDGICTAIPSGMMPFAKTPNSADWFLGASLQRKRPWRSPVKSTPLATLAMDRQYFCSVKKHALLRGACNPPSMSSVVPWTKLAPPVKFG